MTLSGKAVPIAALLTLLAACSSDKRGSMEIGVGPDSCEPFETRECEGAAACETQAVQTCFPTGVGWSACACDRPGTSDAMGFGAGGHAGAPISVTDVGGASSGAGGAPVGTGAGGGRSMSVTTSTTSAGGSGGVGGTVGAATGGAAGAAGEPGLGGMGGETRLEG